MDTPPQPPTPPTPPPKSPDNDSISMLRKQLYQQNESSEMQTRQREMATPKQLPKVRKEKVAVPTLIDVVGKQKEKRKRMLRIALVTSGIFLVVALSAGATFWYRSLHQVKQEQIILSIQAPTDITAGNTIDITYSYKNDSRVRWNNVEVIAETPRGFKVKSTSELFRQTASHKYTAQVGNLDPGQEGTLTISGQLIGEQNEAVLARSQLFLTPENFPNGRFDTSQSASITIAQVPIEISIEAPSGVIEGQRVEVTMNVRNTGSEAFEGGTLLLEPAQGMQFVVEDPVVSPGFSILENSWQMPTLQALEQVSQKIVLLVEGQTGERRVLTVKMLATVDEEQHVLRSVEQVMTIAASEVGISQTMNGTAEPDALSVGQDIEAELTFKNTGTTALSNAIITAKFESSMVDPSTLNTAGGAYDPTTRTITWRSVSVPELAVLQPQQQGTIKYSYSLLTLEKLPTDDSAKNQNLIVTVSIDSPDLAVRAGQNTRAVSDRFVVPVKTNVILTADAFFDDGRLGLPSSGPVPPEVGKTTTYTVRFRLGSSLNDIGAVRMRAQLPEIVRYTGSMYKTEGEIEFNDRTNEITWDVPFITGLSGRTKPGPELHIQVAITPGENLRGNAVELLAAASVEATDVFADVSVDAEIPRDKLLDTEDASQQDGRVE